MKGPNLERWQELCRQAATEQDPKKILELEEKANRLREQAHRKDGNES